MVRRQVVTLVVTMLVAQTAMLVTAGPASAALGGSPGSGSLTYTKPISESVSQSFEVTASVSPSSVDPTSPEAVTVALREKVTTSGGSDDGCIPQGTYSDVTTPWPGWAFGRLGSLGEVTFVVAEDLSGSGTVREEQAWLCSPARTEITVTTEITIPASSFAEVDPGCYFPLPYFASSISTTQAAGTVAVLSFGTQCGGVLEGTLNAAVNGSGVLAGGVFTGGAELSAYVTGDAASEVVRTCVQSIWSASVTGAKDSVGILFNGGLPEDLPGIIDISRSPVKIQGLKATVTIRAATEACSSGAFASWSTPMVISGLSGSITSVTHAARATTEHPEATVVATVDLGEEKTHKKFGLRHVAEGASPFQITA